MTTSEKNRVPATGALNRTWKERLKNYVSVQDFGAVGNHTGVTGTDDTTAIQAAINYAAGNIDSVTYGSYSPAVGSGVVFFPQGSYGVTAALVIPNKVSIVGEGQTEYTFGSRLTQLTANTDLFQVSSGAGSTSFSIEKMVLRSNAGVGTGHLVNMVRSGGGTVNSQRYVDCTFAQPQAMSLKLAGDDVVIKNCLFDVSSDGSGDCIELGTSTMLCTQIRIEGCDFFHIESKCIKLVNVIGLTVTGNTVSQPNDSTRTPYFIDAISGTPTLARNITVTGNTARGVRTFFGGDGVTNVTITGNTVPEAGIGAGETYHLLHWDGTCANVVVSGNNFRGSFENMNFWNSTAATSVTGLIGSNNFVSDGGAGDAFALANFTGRVLPNYFYGFVNPQLSQKHNSTGNAVVLTSILAGGIESFGPITMIGAALGDKVQVGSMSGGWFTLPGLEVLGVVTGTDAVTVQYRNGSAGTINTPVHDIWIEVTR